MSTELDRVPGEYERNTGPFRRPAYDVNHLNVTAFWGGERGPCIQLTPDFADYIQLDAQNVERLCSVLGEWLQRHNDDETPVESQESNLL